MMEGRRCASGDRSTGILVTGSEKKSPVRLFISYAHSDGSELASRLAADLQNSGFTVWWDKDRLRAGASWTVGIETGLDDADVVLAILSRGSYTSDICRAEQLRALRKHKRVLPLVLQNDADMPIHLETEQYIAFYGDYPSSLARLGAAIGDPNVTASLQAKYKKRYRTFPPLPVHFVPRRALVERLRRAIIKESDQRSMPITAIRGMGGIGKSVLAQAICHDEAVQDAYPDGVMWVTIGEHPSNDHLCSQIRELAKALGDALEGYDTLIGCENQLRMSLSSKSVLIVLDDVWDPRVVRYFHGDSPRCRLLLTTRSREVVRGTDAEELTADVMDHQESLELLASKSGLSVNELPQEASEIIERVGSLPLGLAMLGSRAAKGRNEWARITHALKEGKAQKASQTLSDYPYRNLFEAIQVSVDSLNDDHKGRYVDLGVFPPDTPIPRSVLETFWGLDEDEAEDSMEVWTEASLATRDESGALLLHDLQLDYVRGLATNLKGLHRKLLDAYKAKLPDGWGSGPDDGYYFRWLAYHMKEAGELQELRRLLLSPDWMRVKLQGKVSSLIADYEFVANDPDVKLVQQALQLSAYVLDKDPNQMASQLVGRLRATHSTEILSFLKTIRDTQATTWIEPMCPSLWRPGTLLLFTLADHSRGVNAVAVSGDGRRAVSASSDRTLKVWNLETGTLLHTLAGHADEVNAVAVTQDGRQAVSASFDKTLKIWNLETGLEIFTLTGHTHFVNAIAIAEKGQKAISCSDDHTLRVWDLATGQQVHVLTGHTDRIGTVVMTPDGQRAVSASSDNTLKVWDLQSGTELLHLAGHSSSVIAAAVSPDGKYLVSASADKTLKIWSLEEGKEIHTLIGHSSWVVAVSITPDGSTIVSASYDKTLKVWDLRTGIQRHTFSGHSQWINALAITKDGNRAISASPDHTVKIWDLKNGTELRTLNAHSGAVNAVVVTPDGSRAVTAADDTTIRVWKTGTSHRRTDGHSNLITQVAITENGNLGVSASHDKTLKVWDLEGRAELRTLSGHSDSVSAVAISKDGQRAVSASRDRTLKTWDLLAGAELHTLQGHSSPVAHVIVTSDWKWAVSVSEDKALKVWDLATGSELHSLSRPSDPADVSNVRNGPPDLTGETPSQLPTGWADSRTAIAITPDNKRAVVAYRDQTLRVWDLLRGAELNALNGHSGWINAIALTENGKLAISSSCDSTLRLWDIDSGKELRTLAGHSGPVTHVVILSDGARVVSASTDNTIKTWDLNTGSELSSFAGFVSPAADLAVSADGKWLTCVSENKGIRIWSNEGKEIATFMADGSVTCFALRKTGQTIMAGDYLGRVHLLRVHELGSHDDTTRAQNA